MFLFQFFPVPGQGEKKTPVPPAKPSLESDHTIKNPRTSAELANGLNDILKDPNNTGKTVIVYFGADSCAPCKTFGPKAEEMVKAQKEKFLFVKVDLSKSFEEGYSGELLQNLGSFDTLPLVLKYPVNKRDIETVKVAKALKATAPSTLLSREAESPSRDIVAGNDLKRLEQILK